MGLSPLNVREWHMQATGDVSTWWVSIWYSDHAPVGPFTASSRQDAQYTTPIFRLQGHGGVIIYTNSAYPKSEQGDAREKIFPWGGGVIPASVKSKTEPAYTKAAQDAHIRGEVELTISIGKTGIVTDVKVTKPLGYGLDDQAISAVRLWRFNPATKDGQPVSSTAVVTVNFRLM